jgi:hypothetical protein
MPPNDLDTKNHDMYDSGPLHMESGPTSLKKQHKSQHWQKEVYNMLATFN